MAKDFGGLKVKAVEMRNRQYACWRPDTEDNPMPRGPLELVGARFAKEGTDLLVLTLEDKKGERTDATLFPRDFAACTNEWGDQPQNWGVVEFVAKKGISRTLLCPVDPQPQEVEEIV